MLDENILVQLEALLQLHSVKSVNDTDVGCKSIQNGCLLAQMEGSFDLLLTADKSIHNQQYLGGRSISILVLPTNRRRDVLALAGRIAAIVGHMSIGEYVVLDRTGAAQMQSFGRPDDGSP